MASKEPPKWTLPPTMVGPADVTRMKRLLENYDDLVHQATLRAKSEHHKLAKDDHPAPQSLQKLAETAGCNLHDRQERLHLLAELDYVLEHAPTVSLSFAVDPSAEFMAKIVAWLRGNTHPSVLVRVGLQPNIVAGCRLRTPSKIYDFSLRNRFAQQRPMLVNGLRASAGRQGAA